jgi:ribosome-binding protein aMBF1 (putative translation factor)
LSASRGIKVDHGYRWPFQLFTEADAMDEVDRPIGERIAIYRRRRGISQAVLAGLVGRSESWLSQVERGARSVDRLSC